MHLGIQHVLGILIFPWVLSSGEVPTVLDESILGTGEEPLAGGEDGVDGAPVPGKGAQQIAGGDAPSADLRLTEPRSHASVSFSWGMGSAGKWSH